MVAGPGWLADGFVAMMLLTATYCVSRFAASRRLGRSIDRGEDAMHATMGLAMAGMLAGVLRPATYDIWAAVFVSGAAWFAWRALRSRQGRVAGHYLQHLVACGAMVYMFAAMTGSRPALAGMGPMSGMMGASGAGLRLPLVAVSFAVAVFGYAINHTHRLVLAGSAQRSVPDEPSRWPTPSQAPRPAPVVASGSALVVAPGPAPVLAPGAAAAVAPRPVPLLAPRLATCCQIAMCTTMGYMLVAAL